MCNLIWSQNADRTVRYGLSWDIMDQLMWLLRLELRSSHDLPHSSPTPNVHNKVDLYTGAGF